jgi:hypothetical protein
MPLQSSCRWADFLVTFSLHPFISIVLRSAA